jgi:hypothetical protein
MRVSGWQGEHLVQAWELDSMCQQSEREDIIQIYIVSACCPPPLLRLTPWPNPAYQHCVCAPSSSQGPYPPTHRIAWPLLCSARYQGP